MAHEADNQQILILAPVGRDAALLCRALTQTGLACIRTNDHAELGSALQTSVGALLLTEEALTPAVLQVIQAAFTVQPEWSNLPCVLLIDPDAQAWIRLRMNQIISAEQTLTILERPISPSVLAEVMRAALWIRRRQYQVRDLLQQMAQQNESLAREVAERRQAEAALRELNLTLERRVDERTAELAQRNQELDQFAYVSSHDLKAPLRAIDHLANWILQDTADMLPPPSQEHLTKLRNRIKRMDGLLNDLLAYSRAGRQRHSPELVDTGALVRNTVNLLSAPPGFAVSMAGDMPTLRTERVPLETVLRNLITNAIKHHHAPWEGRLYIGAQTQAKWIEFVVADNGPGIDPAFHERIFQVFQTLLPRDQVEGSGMGLAIVKKLVESRGGVIKVESSRSQGATFRFTWPKV
jgi:signal transduction histidine kinase